MTTLAPVESVLTIDPAAKAVGGALVDGMTGHLSMSILILMIVAGSHIMKLGGGLDAIVDTLARLASRSVARAEMAIWSIVFSRNVFITINTAAEITAAPVVSNSTLSH